MNDTNQDEESCNYSSDSGEEEEEYDPRVSQVQVKKPRCRLVKSCLSCHKIKKKCDKGRPCGRCKELKKRCIYEVVEPGKEFSEDPEYLRGRIVELEACLREARVQPYSRSVQGGGPKGKKRRLKNDDLFALPDDSSFAAFRPDLRQPVQSGAPLPAPPSRELIPSKCSPVQFHAAIFHLRPVALFNAPNCPLGYRQIPVQPTAAPFMIKSVNGHFEQRQKSLGAFGPIQPLIDPEVAFRAAPAQNNSRPGIYWMGETHLGGLVEIIEKLIHFLPPPDYAKAIWPGFLEEVETAPKAWTNRELEAIFFRLVAMDPKALANQPFDFALYLVILSLGTYSSHSPPGLDPRLLERMQGSMSPGDGVHTTQLVCVRFWLFAARTIIRSKPEWTSSAQIWQAQIIMALLLENLGLDGPLHEELDNLSRTAFQTGLQLSDYTPVYDNNAFPAAPELIQGRIDSSVRDMSFWAFATVGQPLLPQTQSKHPAADKLREVNAPWHLKDCSFADGKMDDSMYHIYLAECLNFAQEAHDLVFNPDIAKVEDLTVHPPSSVVRALADSRVQRRIEEWTKELPLDLSWKPGFIPGSGLDIAGTPEGQAQAPMVFDLRTKRQLLMLHLRSNMAMLILHRPYANHDACDIAALNAAYNIIQAVKLLWESGKMISGCPLRRRTTWTMLYSALQVLAYQACLYPSEPDMKGVKMQMRLVRKITLDMATSSLPAFHYRQPIEALTNYMEHDVLVRHPIPVEI